MYGPDDSKSDLSIGFRSKISKSDLWRSDSRIRSVSIGFQNPIWEIGFRNPYFASQIRYSSRSVPLLRPCFLVGHLKTREVTNGFSYYASIPDHRNFCDVLSSVSNEDGWIYCWLISSHFAYWKIKTTAAWKSCSVFCKKTSESSVFVRRTRNDEPEANEIRTEFQQELCLQKLRLRLL